MTNGEMIQKVFNCEVCEPILEEDIIHVIFPDKNDSAIGFDWSWWNMEHKEPTTKNNLGVDCVARQDVERFIEGFINEYTPEEELEFINLELDGLKHLPPATPQEPFINKPCVSSGACEHDKQNVFDKLRAEIEKARNTEIKEFNEATDIVEPTSYQRGSHEGYDEAITDVLQIIDKYKAESEK